MRQLLLSNSGVKVARMPAPTIAPGSVLIQVRYSMVSIGTEIATLRPQPNQGAESVLEKAQAASGLARRYLAAAIANPRLAVRRATELAQGQFVKLAPRRPIAHASDKPLGNVKWIKDNADRLDIADSGLELITDQSDWHYQAHTELIDVPVGFMVSLDIRGALNPGQISIGLLDAAGSRWLGTSIISAGAIEDRLIFDPKGESQVKVVIANAQSGKTTLKLQQVTISLIAPDPNGVSQNEMGETGFNLGYSAAGQVVAVGERVKDLVPGDWVACGGAGRANHADFVSVPRNLVCRIPEGCDIKVAATATIGTIAMQGVRRAAPTLGERICVIGLGLLGQISAQLLRANGCIVIGMDLDPERVNRARAGGMEHGAGGEDELLRMVRDLTGGHGVDRTLITAATKSDAVINLAMEVTRRRGTIVIVGDVGLNVDRQHFYRKEIDLLMSTSYGPGRYDASYEEQGIDYPYAYVRWTQNRNMQSYLELATQGRIDVSSLIDEVVSIDCAPDLYRKLASASQPPLGVLLEYPQPLAQSPQPRDATRIALRGHRKVHEGPMGYVLVGAGAYGQSMLVPTMERQRDSFFLRGIVSRDAVRGGNFVRERRLDIFATELRPVLDDPTVRLLVIATRHHEHAGQVVAGLKAGKHVFVEKPLAITWQELDSIVETYEAIREKPIVMVGFNRRFSPALQTLKRRLEGRISPLVINYRLNGGYIPNDHWIQSAQGAGRNIGEACHMYDVFRFLAGAPVTGVQAASIGSGSPSYLRNDNFSATLSYRDGSIGNLVYTALGPKKGLPKERIEVFCDGEAYLVDDFKLLIRCSDGEILWQSDNVDKGHAEELSRLADALMGHADAPISFEELIETSAAALEIEDQLFGRAEGPSPRSD